MPQFLQNLMGYTAESAGMVLSTAAIILLIELPIVGRLTGHIQARYLMAFGWALLTIAMFYSTRRIDLQMSFASATWLRIVQYIPMGFIFIPATMAAYIGVPQEKSNAVAGLINFVRNIGSSVGTSAVTTILARRTQFHQAVLASDTGLAGRMFQSSTSSYTGSMRNTLGYQAHAGAWGRLYGIMLTQASTLSYLDTFWLLGVATGVMFLLSFLLRKNDLHRLDPEVSAH
jgi:DHA2 family multidrug resistance protein